jgi:hypothetical protein
MSTAAAGLLPARYRSSILAVKVINGPTIGYRRLHAPSVSSLESVLVMISGEWLLNASDTGVPDSADGRDCLDVSCLGEPGVPVSLA